MNDRTTAYAELVCDGGRIASEAERLCCERHLKDLKRSKNDDFPWLFDRKLAEYHIKIADMLSVGEGDADKKLNLRGFQCFIIGSIFGWVSKKDKTKRRFTEAYISMGRQNGKSMLCGVLANDFATFSGYQNGKIFCTGTKKDQAKIVWSQVANFIKSDEELLDLYKIKEYRYEIKSKVTGTEILALSGDTKRIDGHHPVLAIVDEYHQHPTNKIYSAMQKGQISLKSPLLVAITTAGHDLDYPCYEQYKMAKGVIKERYDMPFFFVYIAESEMPNYKEDPVGFEDALKDEKNWAKANPYVAWKNDTELSEEGIEKIRKEAMSAIIKGGIEVVAYETKRLNIWVTNSDLKFIDMKKWDESAVEMTLEDMRNRECYLGVDLSEGGDLTSISFLFPLDDGRVFVESQSFIPVHSLERHEQTDAAPYRRWVNNGLLTATNGIDTYGLKTDYKAVIKYIADVQEKYGIRIVEVGYDDRNASAFLVDLASVVNCDLTLVVQSAKSLNDATVDFRLTVAGGAVLHNKQNELLSWSMSHAVIVENNYNQIKIDKLSRNRRIDPCDALIDAWKCYFTKKKNDEKLVSNDVAVAEMVGLS